MMEGVDLGKDITSRGTWLTWIFTGNRKSYGYSSHGLPHGVSKEVGSRIPFLLKEPIVLSLVKPNKKGLNMPLKVVETLLRGHRKRDEHHKHSRR